MDGASVWVGIRVVRQFRIRRHHGYFSVNEETETTSVVRSTSDSSEENSRCVNAFIILVNYAIGIGSIVLGTSYINNCPAEKMVPIGLIIFGGIFVVARVLNCVYDFRSVVNEEPPVVPDWLTILNALLTLAGFGIFFTMFYWLNNVDTDKAHKDPKNYCDPTLCYSVAGGILVGILFVILPCLYSCCCNSPCCEDLKKTESCSFQSQSNFWILFCIISCVI